MVSYGKEVKETTPIEVEDRNFIHHLLKDKYYIYAQEEAAVYLKKYPGGIFRAEIIFAQAEIDVVQKSTADALRKYDLILSRHPESELVEDSLYLSSVIHLQLGQIQRGQTKLQRLIGKYPESRFLYRAIFQLGALAFKQKRWETTSLYLESAVTKGDLRPGQQLEAKNYLAWTYYFQKKTDLANELFLSLLQSNLADSQKAKIGYQYAIDAQKVGNHREAIKWHERLLKQWSHPDFSDRSQFWIAESLFLLSQMPEKRLSTKEKQRAVQLFSRNLALKHPVEIDNSHYHRGWFLLDLGRPEEAENDFNWLQSHSKKYRGDIDLTIIRARFFESAGNWKKANLIYSDSLKLQKEPVNKNELLAGLIRNNYRQKDCPSLIKNFNALTQPIGKPVADEVFFYSGTCYHDLGELKIVNELLGKIDVNSQYAPLALDYYLDALNRTRQQKEGLKYLKRVEHLPHFADKEHILLYKTEFHLELEQWLKALSTMKAVVKLSPAKKKDPWFLLNVARTLDQITLAMKSKKWRDQRPDLKTKTYYHRQAIIYYRESYKYMPLEREAERLSVLDILIKHHEKKRAWKTLVHQYRTAFRLSRDEHQKAEYAYRLAKILIKTGEKRKNIIPLLTDLHGAADREVNFKASALLAELYIEKKDFPTAIETLIELAQQPIDNTQWYLKVHFRLGELYQSQEKWMMSIRHYSKVVTAKQSGSQKQEAKKRLSKIKRFVKQK